MTTRLVGKPHSQVKASNKWPQMLEWRDIQSKPHLKEWYMRVYVLALSLQTEFNPVMLTRSDRGNPVVWIKHGGLTFSVGWFHKTRKCGVFCFEVSKYMVQNLVGVGGVCEFIRQSVRNEKVRGNRK